jgi:large subunit ribosomal protein L25
MLFRRVPVRGLADDLPEVITIDVSNLQIGDNLRVKDLEVPNCTVLLNDSTLLAAVKRTRAAMSAASAEEDDDAADGGEDAAE